MPKQKENYIGSKIIIGIVVIFFMMIIIYIIYYSIYHNSNTPTTGSVDSTCTTNTDCPGLICGNGGKCVISIGGNCVANPNSCIDGSSCIDGVCSNNQLTAVKLDESQILLAQNIALSYSVDKLAYPKNLALKSIQKSNLTENNQFNSPNIPISNQYSFQPRNKNNY